MSGRLRRILRAIEPYPGEHFKDKAIALGLAFVLWFAINNTSAETRIFNVPIAVTGVPGGLAIGEEWDETVELFVSGPPLDMSNVSDGRLATTIDLSGAVAGDNIFPLFAEDFPGVPPGVEVRRITPNQIRIMLESRVAKTVEISPVTSGEPADGYEVYGKTTDPVSVALSGPSSLLEGLERIPTQMVDVSDRVESFTQRVQLLPPSRFIELTDIRAANLSIEIRERSIETEFLNLEIEVVGSQYRVDINPSTISVVLSGPPSVLNGLPAESVKVIIEASGLVPRSQDYQINPQVVFEPAELADQIRVEHFNPQSYIDVHVYNTGAERRQ